MHHTVFQMQNSTIYLVLSPRPDMVAHAYLYLQLHDIPACRSANKAGANIRIVLLQRTHVSGLFIVVYHVLVVCTH